MRRVYRFHKKRTIVIIIRNHIKNNQKNAARYICRLKNIIDHIKLRKSWVQYNVSAGFVYLSDVYTRKEASPINI